MAAVEPDLQQVVDERIAEVAATLDPDAMGAAMGDFLMAAIPEFQHSTDEDFRAGIVMSCSSNLVAITDSLVARQPTEEFTPPADATAWAHELVHRGMPLAVLLRSYRLGHGLFEKTFEDAASSIDLEPDVRWRVLAGAGHHMFRYIDAVCTQLVEDYEREREHWLRGAAAAQSELVRAIVAGEAVDPREAATTLHYEPAGSHLAFLVWGDPRSRTAEQASTLTATARALAAELGGTQTLLLPIGDHVVWAWTTGERLTSNPPARSTAIGEVGVAVGAPHAGLAGMHRSHHEARAARRVGEIFGQRPGTIMRFPAVALASLTSADPVQAVHFVETELGPLGEDTDAMLRLRATLRVYLEERLSPSRAARRLTIHQNTVVYRVKRAEELIGRAIDERRLELEIALRLRDGLDGLRAERDAGRP